MAVRYLTNRHTDMLIDLASEVTFQASLTYVLLFYGGGSFKSCSVPAMFSV